MSENVDEEGEKALLSDNEVYFASTQMQGRYEDMKAESLVHDAQLVKMNELERFKSFDNVLIPADQTTEKNHKQAMSAPKKKTLPKAKPVPKSRRRISSMTSLMKEKYSNQEMEGIAEADDEVADRASKDRLTQLSICSFYSGKRSKVAEILKRIEMAERMNSGKKEISGTEKEKGDEIEKVVLEDDHDDAQSVPSHQETDNGLLVYSKKEWSSILKTIKVKFPNLSSKSRKSLQSVTRQIHKQMSQRSLFENSEESVGGLWSQSSAVPTQKELDIEDMRWLYDLSDNQASVLNTKFNSTKSSFSEDGSFFLEEQPFVTTLSQVLDVKCTPRHESHDYVSVDKSTDEEEANPDSEDLDEIPNSSPELSPIRISSDSLPKHPKDVSPEIDQPISSHQRESMFSMDTLSFPLNGKREQQTNLVNTSSSPIKKQQDEQTPVEIFSSSFSIKSPQKSRQNEVEVLDVEEIVSSPIKPDKFTSPFKTPTKRSGIVFSGPPSNGSSPIRAEQTPYSQAEAQHLVPSPSASSSVYSTAQTNFLPHKVPKVSPVKSRKRYITSIVEIPGNISIFEEEIANQEPHGIKIRKVGSRIEPPVDSEDEIVDSDDEGHHDTSISIIEISREVLAEEEKDGSSSSVSILQVPSSPRKSFSPIKGESFLDELDLSKKGRVEISGSSTVNGEDEVNAFESQSASQLKEVFKAWGLKPVQGKSRMVEILNNLSQHIDTSQGQDLNETESSQSVFQSSIFRKINETIQRNQYWHDKVLSYEPIVLNDLQDWLEKDGGIKLELDILESYSDKMGITTTVRKDPKDKPKKGGKRSKAKKQTQ